MAANYTGDQQEMVQEEAGTWRKRCNGDGGLLEERQKSSFSLNGHGSWRCDMRLPPKSRMTLWDVL